MFLCPECASWQAVAAQVLETSSLVTDVCRLIGEYASPGRWSTENLPSVLELLNVDGRGFLWAILPGTQICRLDWRWNARHVIRTSRLANSTLDDTWMVGDDVFMGAKWFGPGKLAVQFWMCNMRRVGRQMVQLPLGWRRTLDSALRVSHIGLDEFLVRLSQGNKVIVCPASMDVAERVTLRRVANDSAVGRGQRVQNCRGCFADFARVVHSGDVAPWLSR